MSEDVVNRLISEHGRDLIGLARRFSASAPDAEDAYQQALETLITKAPSADLNRLVPWMKTVVRNEALLTIRGRKRFDQRGFDELAANWRDDRSEPVERLIDGEELGRGREALMRIRPDHVRCLLLRADGLNYDEIREITGFSPTQVARYLCEGRKAFRERVEAIDEGSECRRLRPALSMMADGLATNRSAADAKLHLRNCVACQTTLREFQSIPGSVAALFPVGAAFSDIQGGPLDSLLSLVQSVFASIQDRVAAHLPSAQIGAEAATAKKVATVVAISASLAAGGTTVKQLVTPDSSDTPVQGRENESERLEPTSTTGSPSLPPPPSNVERDRERGEPRPASATDVATPGMGLQTDKTVAPTEPSAFGEADATADAADPVTADPVDSGDQAVGDLLP